MKEINFRIIELPTHQVLIQKDFNNDDNDESNLMIITFFLDGIKIKHHYGYDYEYTRDEAFDKVSNQNAQKLVDDAIKILNS
jgi:hypothetical protein